MADQTIDQTPAQQAKELFELMVAPIKAWVLQTALELKLFEHLQEPKSALQVAEVLGCHKTNTEAFLDACCASGYLSKQKGLYQNLSIVENHLLPQSPTFLGGLLLNTRYYWLEGLDYMAEAVLKGPVPEQEAIVQEDSMWRTMCQGLAASQRLMLIDLAKEAMNSLDSPLSVKKVLDLGGGPGLVGMALVQELDRAKGVIFDQPAVVDEAQKYIDQANMVHCMTVKAGDFTTDDLGTGYDLIWASGCLYFAKKDLQGMMRRIYQALNPGGVFISLHEGLTNQRTNPPEAVLSMLLTSLRGEHDMLFEQGELRQAMEKAGFGQVKTQVKQIPWGEFYLEIGVKPG